MPVSIMVKNKIDVTARKRRSTSLFLITFLFLLLLLPPSLTCGAEKALKARPKAQPKPQAASIQKEVVVNDANLMTYQKKVEDLVGKGDFNSALKIMLKINDYTGEVLSTVKSIRTEYEKAVGNPKITQKEKEDIFVRLRGLDRLVPRYTNYYEASTFNLGYMYAKLGETEKARKYLTEFLQMTPYSGSRDSQWIRAKTLLLELYSLEGEF